VNRTSLSLFFPALLLACGSPPTGAADDIDQAYLFEVEYVNHAWGLAWRGLVIDRNGNINAYDHGHEIWQPPNSDSYTESELDSKYEHGSRQIGQVDEATIKQQFSRIASVDGQLSAPQYPCADAGGLTYRAFLYEAATGLYRPLLLRQEGDKTQENTSDAAEELAGWLRNLVSALEDPGVTPFNEGTCTP